MLCGAQTPFQNEQGIQSLLYKNLYFAKLLRGQYLSKILQTSSTVKTKLKSSKKADVSENLCDEECDFFSEMTKECKVFCAKILFYLVY